MFALLFLVVIQHTIFSIFYERQELSFYVQFYITYAF